MIILNVAGGKFAPLPLDSKENIMLSRFILGVDTSYFSDVPASALENQMKSWANDGDRCNENRELNMDAFEFMERTCVEFDRVAIYRFLEHVTFTQVEYFIYLVSTVIRKGGMVDVIVPNYTQLAEMILNETAYFDDPCINFPAHNILLTTELLNEPSCPHASLWTPERMKYFWELEGRFKVKSQDPAFKFDGRDIYLRAIIERI